MPEVERGMENATETSQNWGPGDCLAFGIQNMIICVTSICLGNVAAYISFPLHLLNISLPPVSLFIEHLCQTCYLS